MSALSAPWSSPRNKLGEVGGLWWSWFYWGAWDSLLLLIQVHYNRSVEADLQGWKLRRKVPQNSSAPPPWDSPIHNFPVATVGMFETKMLVPCPPQLARRPITCTALMLTRVSNYQITIYLYQTAYSFHCQMQSLWWFSVLFCKLTLLYLVSREGECQCFRGMC